MIYKVFILMKKLRLLEWSVVLGMLVVVLASKCRLMKSLLVLSIREELLELRGQVNVLLGHLLELAFFLHLLRSAFSHHLGLPLIQILQFYLQGIIFSVWR